MTDNTQLNFTNLHDIHARKDQVLKEIRRDSDQINKLRNNLFKKEVSKNKRFGMSNMISAGTGVFDGLLLVWKLYRKFKK